MNLNNKEMVIPVNSIHKLDLYFNIKKLDLKNINDLDNNKHEVHSMEALLELERIFLLNEEIKCIEDSIEDSIKVDDIYDLTNVPSDGASVGSEAEDDYKELQDDLFYKNPDSNSSDDSLRTITQDNHKQFNINIKNNIQQVNLNHQSPSLTINNNLKNLINQIKQLGHILKKK